MGFSWLKGIEATTSLKAHTKHPRLQLIRQARLMMHPHITVASVPGRRMPERGQRFDTRWGPARLVGPAP